MKPLLSTLYVAIIVCMAAATLIEKYQGTAFVSAHIYGAWWFSLLWALLVAVGVAWIIRRRMRRASAWLLHLSMVVILAGALLTHLTARSGWVHLRQGQTANTYTCNDGSDTTERPLPFALRLDTFSVSYHDGTMAASDYTSHLTLIDGNHETHHRVSMNNILSHRGIRLYQSSYDEDGKGSTLTVNSDPWGIPVTYTGYALLFIALLWMLADPRDRYRQLLRKAASARIIALVALASLGAQAVAAPHALPRNEADAFGRLFILYNDRICPVQTFAQDFTRKLYGKAHYGDYTAEQVLTGFLFWPDEWSQEPLLKLKSGPLRETLQLPRYCSVNTFFNPLMGGYTLGPYLQEYYAGRHDKFHEEVMKLDDRLQLIMQLRQGTLLRIFPFTAHTTIWYSPTDRYPDTVEPERQQYMRQIFALLNEDIHANRTDRVDETLAKMRKYQFTFGGMSLPTKQQVQAERLYNALPLATILFMVNLSMALLLGIVYAVRGLPKRRRFHPERLILLLSLLALTLCLALRWIISGTIPMANGYETMLLMAWMMQLLALLMCRRFPVMTLFGFLMSGFFLLVSHLSQMDPQISHVMPVLQSPLLTIHVSIIMMAYALLALTFVCGIVGLFARKPESLHLLSQLLLYPALACLCLGIFIGAIWANVSWGTYWSWDPKETWALITLMVYAVAVHDRSLPWLQRPRHYHLFIVLAFLTLLMTYFGVNYFLGGMHSYA